MNNKISKRTKLLAGVVLFLAALTILTSGCVSGNSGTQTQTSTQTPTTTPAVLGNPALDLGGTTWANFAQYIAFGDDGKVSGNAGINKFTATYTVNDKDATKNISIIGISTTKMAGTFEASAIENKFIADLKNVTSYTVSESELKLLDRSGKVLISFTKVTLPDTTWKLTEITGVSAPKVSSSDSITLTFTDGIYGFAGVNNYFADCTINGDKLTISNAGSTKMAGTPELMTLENAYLSAINKAASYKIIGDALYLYDADGNEILTLSRLSLPQSSWTLTELYENGNTVSVPAGAKVTLSFDTETLGGNAGCNGYGASYTTDGLGGITLSREGFVSTLMYCENTSEFESKYLGTLEKAASYDINGNELIIYDANDLPILKFEEN